MEIDLVQVATNLIVGGVSAWLAGKFGIRHGLEQAKRERAFDQRLDWHLRTIRAMKKFQLGMEEYLSAAKDDRAAAIPIAAKVEPIMMEFLMCANEATLFTDRDSVVRLKDGAVKFCQMLHATAQAKEKEESWDAILRKTASTNKLVESIEFELTRRLRDQLGLDKIKAEDLGT